MTHAGSRRDFGSRMDDFLDEIFSLDGTEEESPLIYADHETVRQSGSITGIKVRLGLRDPTQDITHGRTLVCRKLHSSSVRDYRTCRQISGLDIFGLEPLPRTDWSILWDTAFLYQLLKDGRSVLSSIRRIVGEEAGRAVVGCEWLRVALFTFIEAFVQGRSWWELVQRIVGQMPPEQMTTLVQSLMQQAASLLNGLAVSYSRAVNKL